MRVCFAIGTLNYSGAEKIMYHLIKKFCEFGHDVSLMLLATDKPFEGLCNVKQYPIYDIKEESESRIKRTLRRQRKIKKLLSINKYDVVVSFGYLFNVDVAEACMFTRTKIILCERNDPLYDPKTKIKRLRRNISYNRGNGFVFQTEVIKSFFNRRIQSKSVVIPNFIESRTPIEECYSPQKNVIATSCRIDNYQKDLATLINAFAIFNKTHPDYNLEFYGDGPDKDKMIELSRELGVEKNVIFWGKVTNPMNSIHRCRVFVLSSNYEGMPNALIEAMSYGMPCIASDCSGGGAKALIKDGINGFLFNVGDTKKLAGLFERLCDDDELARSIGERAYEINDTLEINKIVEEWISFTRKIANK